MVNCEKVLWKVVKRLIENESGVRVLDIDHRSIALGSFVLSRYNFTQSSFSHMIEDCPTIERWVENALSAGGEDYLYNMLWTVKQLLET